MMKNESSIYENSYHLFKVLCLFSLILNHSWSFLNEVRQMPLNNSLFSFLCSIGIFFLMLASEPFYRSIESSNTTNSNSIKSMIKYLFFLCLIDILKHILIFDSFIYFFYWDFLKTLLLSYILIFLLRKISLYMIPLTSLLITFYFSDIKGLLINLKDTLLQSGVYDPTDNIVHLYIMIISYLIFSILLYCIYKLRLKKSLKYFFFFIIFGFYFFVLKESSTFNTSYFQYSIVKTWYIDGLVGGYSDNAVYTFLAWLPSILNTYFLISLFRNKHRFYENNKLVIFSLLLLLLGIVLYIEFYHFKFLRIHPGQIVFWQHPGLSSTHPFLELHKLTLFIFTFLSLVEILRASKINSLHPLILKLSYSSFFIYILFTSFTRFVARYLAETELSFEICLSITVLLTLIFSILIAKIIGTVQSKRISLRFRKV